MPWVAEILEKVDLLAVGVSDIFQPEQSIHTLVSSGPISTQVERHFSLAAELAMVQPLYFLSSAEIFKGNEA